MSRYDLIINGLHVLELLACIAGVLSWKKIKDTYWKWFPFYLLLIVIAEVTAIFVNNYQGVKAGAGIYRYFAMPLQMLFFFWLFYQEFKPYRRRVLPVIATLLFIGAYIYELVAVGTLEGWINSFSYTVGNVLLAGLIIVFFLRFIQTDRLLNFKADTMFWVSIGALIFYVGSLPYYGLYNILRTDENMHILVIYWYFQMAFNYLMYTCFIIAFLWGRPK